MKEHIKRLERSHEFWTVIGLGVVFFLLRLPSLFEPYWYGDEGIYQTLGLAITKGRILYTGIWDNKPPLLYYTYALVHSSQFAIRSLSLLVGLGAIALLFLLAKKLFNDRKSALIATGVFVLSFGLPTFEGNIANAENFMLLPIIAAGYVIYSLVTKNRDFTSTTSLKLVSVAGLLLGFAFLYKIVAIFDFAAFFVFLIISTYRERFTREQIFSYLNNVWKLFGVFIVGFIFPFFLTILYFALNHALGEYIRATFLSTVGYVGYKNAFIIPQGLLISKVIILAIFCLILFIKRQKTSSTTLFISLWVAFSLFNSFFSQRPYTHYVLVLVPAFSLLVGKTFLERKSQLVKYAVITLIVGYLGIHYFDHWNISKTIHYYTNFTSFTSGNKSVNAYDTFFDRRTIRDYEIISYLNQHKQKDSTLYVWGNDAQIYPLTGTIPPGRFTVAYHVAGNHKYEKEIGDILKNNPPHFLVIMRDVPVYPFPMYNYRQVLSVQNADIYERNN